MVSDPTPPLRGATGGVGDASLIRSRLTEPSGMVPLTQVENLPHNVCVHDVHYVRFGLVRIGSRVPGLSLVTVAVRSVVNPLTPNPSAERRPSVTKDFSQKSQLA